MTTQQPSLLSPIPGMVRHLVTRDSDDSDSLRLVAIGQPGRRIRFEATSDFGAWKTLATEDNPDGLLFHRLTAAEAHTHFRAVAD